MVQVCNRIEASEDTEAKPIRLVLGGRGEEVSEEMASR